MSAYTETSLHPFTLIPGGQSFGLFRLGIAVMSMLDERLSTLVRAIGSAAARMYLPLFGIHRRLFGKPLVSARNWQIGSLFGALVAESILISIIISVFYGADTHVFGLCVLLAVGVHFMVMGITRGYPMTMFGIFCILDAVSGLFSMPFPMRLFRLFDNLLRAGFSWQTLMIEALDNSVCDRETKAIFSQ